MFYQPGPLFGRQLDNAAFFSGGGLTAGPDSHKRNQGN
jgi:hypothetical protein